MAAPRCLISALLLMTATCSYADTLTFQHGDGGAHSEMLGTTINSNTSTNFGVHFLLTVRSHDMQGLVRFPDIIGSNPGQIPPGSTIQSATLGLTMYDVAIEYETLGEGYIHEVYVPWIENIDGLTFYSQPGPHYGPAVAVIPVADVLEVVSGDMTPVVQRWAGGAANHGVMLRNDLVPASGEVFITRYYSDDAQTPEWRPKLTVEFTPPNVATEATTWGKVKALYR